MRQGFLRRSRFSPGNMSHESLEALFVGRHDVLDDVLSRITRSIQNPEKHFILLVGPRGSGKTHFLALAHNRLMDWLGEADVRDKVEIAVLKEEEWGVASYLDFVVRILRALARTIPGLSMEIAEIYDRFSREPAAAEALALERLRQHTHDKTLVLLCENLADLFHGLDEKGQKQWRATIQEDGNWTILASTPTLFAGLTHQDSPFYGFFTIRPLKAIDLDTGIELLVKKAVHEGNLDLADFLRTPLGRARARAIHHLAAGNHRAYIILFDFLDRESLDDLVEPFMHMVDDLTPYYQDKMRQLPPAQRKIVEFLCFQSKPMSVKDISSPCLMSHQTATKQIGALETAGFVNRIRFGRNTYCELSEPLMRICIEVKDNTTQHFRLLVEFLRHWFTTRELERRRFAFQRDDHTIEFDSIHVAEAVRCSHVDNQEPFIDALNAEADRCWDADDYKGLAKIQEVLARDSGSVEDYFVCVMALVRAGNAQSAIEIGKEAIGKYPDHRGLNFWLAHAFLAENRFVEALSTVDHSIACAGEVPGGQCLRADILIQLGRFEDAIQAAEAVHAVDPDHWHSFGQMITALVSLGRLRDAETCARDLVRFAHAEPAAFYAASRFYLSQDQLDHALLLADTVLNNDPDHHEARRLRGYILFKTANYRRASEELQIFASHHPDSVSTHCWLADSLFHSGDWEDATRIAEHLIEIDPAHSHAYHVLGQALIKLDRPGNAIAAFDNLLATDDYESLLGAASGMRSIGDYDAARKYIERAVELQPDDREIWIERTLLHIDERAFDAAVKSSAKVASLEGASLLGRLLATQVAAATVPLHVALKKLERFVEPEEFNHDNKHIKATAGILSISVLNFGPQFLPQGLETLKVLLRHILDQGVLGAILTDFLNESVDDGFSGSLAEWEVALDRLALSLVDAPDCRIPVDMLRAAVRFSKTSDQRHLLGLPLEQRQLLEDALTQATPQQSRRN